MGSTPPRCGAGCRTYAHHPMPTFTAPPSSAEQPAQAFLVAFNRAFMGQPDKAFIASCLAEDFSMDMVGEQPIPSKAAFLDMMDAQADMIIDEMHIEAVIAHGQHAAVHGTMRFTNGQHYAFCDLYTLSGTSSLLIQHSKSFMLSLKGGA